MKCAELFVAYLIK